MHFSRRNQPELLEAAKAATFSTGFKSDAVALGAYGPDRYDEGGDQELIAVGVFQNFVGRQAEFHFGLVHGRNIGRDVAAAFVAVAFHPHMLALERLTTTISAQNPKALVAAIKMGFEIEARLRSGMSDGTDAILLSIVPDDALTPLPGTTKTTN